MEHLQPQQDPDKKMGKAMLVVAWIAGFGLLVLFFDDLLTKQFNPNETPLSYQNENGTEVRLKRNRQGHYVTSGFINGQKVTFMLDTGATLVSIPYHLAAKLNLDPGARSTAMTANGSVTVAQTLIEDLRLGDIYLQDVRASLNPGQRSDQILLGMSVLKHLEFTQQGEWLILRSR